MQEQSWINKAAKQKQPYNHSSRSKSFLQRQHELVEKKGESNEMLEFHSQPTPKGSQTLFRMRYAIRCWVDDQTTQKALVRDPSRRLARQRVQAVP
ncbi:CACTA en-spm transposon protein [Cucumis melo var. makuwa]|uniref:CACTA en-spm transposon protein n=1 Tax=Cucumis melo var. makuwa TaxID=1194695 RepID=A0A5D3DSD2_CUCMM|nr:CACTA en-spm transposon protein [Cucumis melo var. makuwa]TYK26616.1 CACTA en-spm transposon protein [Cucumis melo var. makuwa]